MKRIIIGTVVATVIFFLFEMLMWMGGFNDDYTRYTPNQEAILEYLNENLEQDGLYSIPTADPASENFSAEREQIMQERVGKPWAMIFYHREMKGMGMEMILGIIYTLIACLVVAMIVYYGNFPTFGNRFLASMAFAVFIIFLGALNSMNWWDFPWSFVKTEVISMTVGWAIVSLWLAWYVRRDGVVATT